MHQVKSGQATVMLGQEAAAAALALVVGAAAD
jgi:hypothetical protein